jgi:uncharacterized protein YqgC (DUF456 family)
MAYLWATILTVANLVWLAMNIFGLPGNWLIVASTLTLAWFYPHMFSVWTLSAIVVVALIGEVMEFLAGMVGAKAAGASRKGAWAALLGAMIGAIVGTFTIPIPVIGTLIGAAGGAAICAWGVELLGGRSMKASAVAGAGSGAGRILGTLAKLALGALLWIIAAVATFWP